MWLLDTSRAELHYFTDPAAVPGGYAILSHTWSHNAEQSFQDVRKIIARCKVAGENPREHVLDKIKRCCEITERDGYAWVWIDSCCIDKTSSSELSEAINSMFTWYALSEVCYAYLEDVHFGDDPHAKKSEFKRARWHTRGWTLQELLAPSFVVFLSQEWKPIGTKHDLCGPLQKCTGIYSKYLTRKLNFLEAPIARRMSWAAKRKTTRVEDEAYCLLGLFDINMPTLYGEGQQAFQRLQSELVKQNIDTSLYAWGTWHESSDAELPQGSLSVVRNGFHGPNHTERFLYAPSPKEFRWMDDVYYTPDLPGKVALQPYLKHQGSEDHKKKIGRETEGLFGQAHLELPTFQVTPYGMKCRFPVAEVDGVTIAVLLCETTEEHLGLFLHPAPRSEVLDPTREAYSVSWAFREGDHGHISKRVACLGGDLYNLRFRGKPVDATWRDIYIIEQPRTTSRSDGAHLVQSFFLDITPIPFRVPRSLLQALSALELYPKAWKKTSDPMSTHTSRLLLQNIVEEERVRIMLGLCTKASTTPARPCHWAWAEPTYRGTSSEKWSKDAHDCATDHIADWPDRARAFGDAERTIKLMFTPCPHMPGRTLVLGLELSGEVYEKMQHEADVRLPQLPRAQLLLEDGAGSLDDDAPASFGDHPGAVPASTTRATEDSREDADSDSSSSSEDSDISTVLQETVPPSRDEEMSPPSGPAILEEAIEVMAAVTSTGDVRGHHPKEW